MTAKEFRAFRTKSKLSLREMADVFEVAATTIHRWEKGLRKVPKFVPTAIKLGILKLFVTIPKEHRLLKK